MIRQTVFSFKLEKTEEALTAHGGLALMAEYNNGMGLRGLVDRYLPGPGSNRGYAPSVFVDSLVLIPRKRAQVVAGRRPESGRYTRVRERSSTDEVDRPGGDS